MAGEAQFEPGTMADAGHRHLWSPWRMRYVGGEKAESGCIFCKRLATEDDRQSLILHRDKEAFMIMNLYPYNTGHSMLVPNQHAASPEDLVPAASAAMSSLRGPLLKALRRALSCQGFNLGMNVGATAGAGIADHLHEHVVPRWTGDANFMPILANTTVMPELIPVTYAKLRAELARELSGASVAGCALFAARGQHILIDIGGHLPQVVLTPGEAVWRQATVAMRRLVGTDVVLTGWAGTDRAGGAAITLELYVDSDSIPMPNPAPGWRWAPAGDVTINTTT